MFPCFKGARRLFRCLHQRTETSSASSSLCFVPLPPSSHRDFIGVFITTLCPSTSIVTQRLSSVSSSLRKSRGIASCVCRGRRDVVHKLELEDKRERKVSLISKSNALNLICDQISFGETVNDPCWIIRATKGTKQLNDFLGLVWSIACGIFLKRTNLFMLLEEIDICLLELDEVNHCFGELELLLDL